MLNKTFLYGTQFIYSLFHIVSFGFFFYHSALFIGEVDITGELSILEAIAVQLAALIFIFVDYFVIKFYIRKSLRKLTICSFLIIDSLLLLCFFALSVLFIVFCVSISLQGNTFAEALPYIALNTLIEIIIGGLFIGTRIKLFCRKRRNTGHDFVSATETTE